MSIRTSVNRTMTQFSNEKRVAFRDSSSHFLPVIKNFIRECEFLLQHCVLRKGNSEDWHEETKDNSIVENVMLRGKILFLFINQIPNTPSMMQHTGIATNEMRSIME